PYAHPRRAQGAREPHDALLVGPPHDERTVRTEQLLDRDDLTDGLEAEGLDERERLVEQDLLTGLERGEVDRGRDGDVHLASRADDVGRARGPRRDELRVAARRLGSLVELLLELDDLLARGVQGRGEPLVLRREQL